LKQRGRIARWLGSAAVLIWSLVPIYWSLKTSLETEAAARAQNYVPLHPTLGNYATLLTRSGDLPGQIRRATLNIVIECGAATIVTVVLATLAAYAFARMRFRGRQTLFYAVLATMAFPAYTTLIPLYKIMSDFYLVNTYTGIVLVYVSGFLPLATWVLHNYFASMPIGLEEAALIDGASRLQVLRRIVLPLARPGIISTALITFLFAWAQFLFPLVLSTDSSTQPLTVVIAALQGRHVVPSTLLNAAGVLAIAVPALLALGFNRYIVNGLLAGSNR
jgi:ABC-type glycerol-3-phosphate transport system permease component